MHMSSGRVSIPNVERGSRNIPNMVGGIELVVGGCQANPTQGHAQIVAKTGGVSPSQLGQQATSSERGNRRKASINERNRAMNKPTTKQYQAALLIVSAYQASAPSKPKKAKKAKNTFVTDMRSRREVRFEAKPLGGLTSAQRSKIARRLEKKLGGEYSRKQWTKAVAEFKAGGFR